MLSCFAQRRQRDEAAKSLNQEDFQSIFLSPRTSDFEASADHAFDLPTSSFVAAGWKTRAPERGHSCPQQCPIFKLVHDNSQRRQIRYLLRTAKSGWFGQFAL
jgi:hypothetical protein